MGNKRLLSVVVPIYFEEKVVPEFYARVKKVLLDLQPKIDHEIVFIDDGSNIGRWSCSRVSAKRTGQFESSAFPGILDTSLPSPPGWTTPQAMLLSSSTVTCRTRLRVIPQMVEKWEEGFQVVYGVREKGRGENPVKLLTAKLFYRLIKLLSDTELPLDAGELRLLDRKVVDALKSHSGRKSLYQGPGELGRLPPLWAAI